MKNSESESNLQASCAGNTPVSSRKQMSSTLRERLKRSSRYFTSPQSTLGRKATFTSPSANTSHHLDQHKTENHSILDHGSRLLFNGESGKCESVKDLQMKSDESFTDDSLVQDEKDVRQLNTRKRPRTAKNCDVANIGQPNPETGSPYVISTSDQQLCQSRGPDSISNPLDSTLDQLKQAKIELLDRTAQKEETLRKLNLVKMYRAKNDLTQLEQLTAKWHQVCQVAIQDLWQLLDEPRPSLSDLLRHLQIDFEKVGYSAEDESFS